MMLCTAGGAAARGGAGPPAPPRGHHRHHTRRAGAWRCSARLHARPTLSPGLKVGVLVRRRRANCLYMSLTSASDTSGSARATARGGHRFCARCGLEAAVKGFTAPTLLAANTRMVMLHTMTRGGA